MKEFLLDKFLLENNKGIEGMESFSDSLSLVRYDDLIKHDDASLLALSQLPLSSPSSLSLSSLSFHI